MHATAPLWGDPAAWTNPAALEGDARADVCVVGLGGSGLAAIGALLDAGASVVGIDAGPVGGGAAGRNGGFLLGGAHRTHHRAVGDYGRERAVGLYRQTLAEIERLAVELGPEIVRLVGSARVPVDAEEAADCAAHLAALRADGFDAEPLGDGLLIRGDGAVDPLARCRALASRALARGARLHAFTPALEVHGDRVSTPAGEVSCRAVVVAVDGGLERVLPELAGRVRSTRLQMLATAPAPPMCERPVYHRWGYDYWQQLPDGRIALGGVRDRHADEEWGAGAEPSEAVQADLDAILRDVIGSDAPVTHRWAGVVGYTTDELPVLEAVRPGVLAVGGHNGHGNVMGSACARAAADIALGRPAPPLARLVRPALWDDGSTSS
ncbi:MAG: gamma-glutamylputrescine oxidase [Solirubrobacteraceae bacterium]|nr:gamma-glutamylputrescine oxidase [Solirubrobacteraceae bacterium]